MRAAGSGRDRIAALIPPHHCYVEPFAGGLAVLRAKMPAVIEVVNDLDGELIHLATLPMRYAISTARKRPIKDLVIANYPLPKTV